MDVTRKREDASTARKITETDCYGCNNHRSDSLARWFGVPRYYVLGALFCLVSFLTLILVPSGAAAGPIIARYLISSMGCAASAWLISIASLLELQKLLSVAG